MAGELVATEAAMPADSTQIAVQEEGGRTSKRLGLPPWAVLVLVAVLGCVDGGLRARYGLATILGETLEAEHELAVDERSQSPAFTSDSFTHYDTHDSRRRLLMQEIAGGTCHEQWNCITGLVCREGVCASCIADSECHERNSKAQCMNTTTGVPLCKHKKLFHPFDSSDMWITVITFFTIILAAPAGVGGGGILVPMYLAIGQFSPHYGIPLSKATIFGGAVSNNYFNVQRRHPVANRPLIDYNTCMMLEPVLLLGTIIGVFFNAVSPGWLITSLLVCSLTWTTYRTTIKAKETYTKEEASAKEAEHLLSASRPSSKHSSFNPENLPPPLRDIVEREANVNFHAIGILAVSWIIIAFFSILKGGEGGGGIVPCGTFWYWVLVAAPLPLVLTIVWYCGNQLSDEYEIKVKNEFEFAEGDLHWNRRNVRLYPMYCISAGFAAGALGIAAGTILGPVLLELGMSPLVGTSSSGFMVIFTASSTTFQFLVMGQLQIDYGAFFCFIGLIGGAIGNTVVTALVKKYKKAWFVVAILAAVLGASTILMGFAGWERAELAYNHGKNMGIRPLCPVVLPPGALNPTVHTHNLHKETPLIAQDAKEAAVKRIRHKIMHDAAAKIAKKTDK